MKIQSKNTITLKILASVALLIIFTLSYLLYASNFDSWPFSNKTEDTQQTKKNNTTDNTRNTEKNINKDESGKNKDDTEYISPKITHPPTDTTPYPIENERYRIEQNSQTDYVVELYPIINNPKYSNYNEQLRDYKREVLEYLKSRYGNTDNFNIQWIPEDANNI